MREIERQVYFRQTGNILEERYPIFFNSPKHRHVESIWREVWFWFVYNFFTFQLTDSCPHSESETLAELFLPIQYPQKKTHKKKTHNIFLAV